MRLEALVEKIEKRSPLSLQEDWDNSGFQIKTGNPEIYRVLIALEISDAVIREAVDRKAEVIVTHHPMYFHPCKRITAEDITGRWTMKLIQKSISVYSIHTPFDKCDGGNNDYLGRVLHLHQLDRMEEDVSGFCRCGYVDGDCSIAEYIQQIEDWLKMDVSYFRFVGDPALKVEKVGLCTGAGAEFIPSAKAAGCDLFVTGDVKYHDARLARDLDLNVLDLGHFGSEKIFVNNMSAYLREHTSLDIFESAVNLNPFTIL